MSKKENDNTGNSRIASFVLSEGRWGENISWQFIVSTKQPNKELCTAVCCITTFENKLLLVRNKRGWECPAGHINADESLEQAVSREVKEETCAIIDTPQIFGYKKLTALKPVLRSDTPDLFYPFPYSYVVFYHANVVGFSDEQRTKDVEEIKFANYDEAKELLAVRGQYENVLEYLLENKKINLI